VVLAFNWTATSRAPIDSSYKPKWRFVKRILRLHVGRPVPNQFLGRCFQEVVMPAFLRAYSGKSVVYEVSLEAGAAAPAVTIGPPADISWVDRIQLLDPTVADPQLASQLQFSVFSGSLGVLDWTRLDFSTRCFLTPAGRHKLAPVSLQLEFRDGQIWAHDFQIFEVDPDNSTLPRSINDFGLQGFTFTVGLDKFYPAAPPFLTPEPLAKLGLAIYYPIGDPPGGWGDPQLKCCPQESGILFVFKLPLDGLATVQYLKSYGIGSILTTRVLSSQPHLMATAP
jgi:hypothetical protein